MAVALIFFDLTMPLGVAAGIAYVPVVLLSIWLPLRSQVRTVIIVTIIFILIGYFFTALQNTESWIVLVNRGLSLLAIISTGSLIYLQNRPVHLKNSSVINQNEYKLINGPISPASILNETSHEKVNKIGYFGILIALPIFIIIVGMNFWLSYQSDHAEIRIKHSHEVQKSLSQTLSILQDAEIGQRGYLLTNDIKYLEPYTIAIADLTVVGLVLYKLNQSNPNQLKWLDMVYPLIDSKLEVLQQTIYLMKTEGHESAMNLVLSGEGKNLMEQIRSIFNEMDNQESMLLIDISQSLQTNNRLAVIGQFLGFSVFMLAGMFIFFKARKLLSSQYITEQELRFMADTDSVTGLLNERALKQKFQRLVKHGSALKGQPLILRFTLIYYRNYFQLQRDHGNDLANEALQKAAELLRTTLPKDIIFGRLNDGGFLAINDGLALISSSLWKEVNKTLKVGDFEFSLDPTAILLEYPKDGLSFDSLLMHASVALQRAYKDRNPILKFNYDFYENSQKRSKYASQIKSALASGQFKLYLQPKVSLHNQQVIGAEALIRWNHPDDGLLAPAHFLDIVEHSNARYDFTLFVIRQSAMYLKQLNHLGHDIELSFNLNAYDINDPRIITALRDTMGYFDIAPGTLQVELTETVTAYDVDSIIVGLDEVSNMGYSIAMDDFGTGMSSLAYCHRLPIQTIKIDRSFIQEIQGSRRSQLLVKTILAMAKGFSWNVIAEGIESGEVASLLHTLGCEQGQGYHFSKPIPFDDFCDLLPKVYPQTSSR